jgi:hypothetical protein
MEVSQSKVELWGVRQSSESHELKARNMSPIQVMPVARGGAHTRSPNQEKLLFRLLHALGMSAAAEEVQKKLLEVSLSKACTAIFLEVLCISVYDTHIWSVRKYKAQLSKYLSKYRQTDR